MENFAYLCETLAINHHLMEEIETLCRAVEVAVNRKMSVASDFKWLAQKIFERTHEQISYMTLMRAWGYVGSSVVGKGTLNILSHFLGYMSFEDFAAREALATKHQSVPTNVDEKTNEESAAAQTELPAHHDVETTKDEGLTPKASPTSAEPAASGTSPTSTVPAASEESSYPHESASATSPSVIPPNRNTVRVLSVIIVLLLVVIGWGSYALTHRTEKPAVDERYILRKGQSFASYADYLSLFGLTEDVDHPWSQPLPHHNNIIVFGGQYHHPRWGNEGDSTDLLPTRTEYWHDDSLPSEVGEIMIREHYYVQKESNRLIITFMKDLVDTTFVFCGVYRMSLEQSDTTHVVWERVADKIDLLHLEYLEQLRN